MEKNSQRKSFVLKHLRRASLQWPPRYAALKDSRIGRGLYKCEKCKSVFKGKDIQIDHIKPVIDVKTGFVDYNTYVERLLCERAGFSALCSFCHSDKTLAEGEERVKFNVVKRSSK